MPEHMKAQPIETGGSITYVVNGEKLHVPKPAGRDPLTLTVGEILAEAGFTPVEDYELTRNDGHQPYASPDENVPIHGGEQFTATYKGPTQVS